MARCLRADFVVCRPVVPVHADDRRSVRLAEALSIAVVMDSPALGLAT
jgi:hypothetical protein